MTRNSAQEWKDMHHQAGLQEGLVNEARNILRRQLVRRFGSLSERIEAKLNGASREQLEDWIDRPYEVEELEDVFR
ncbi:DUF4351 domain-containing protein [Alloalcanivorax xenomutans]|uniref:DUF4351 domain-containing protein n=2 Tax=Alloalcanivorax xenomutans TaxID=1094342 RepID=A0A9Q3W4Y4_9GAMM|nr:DUF4351 domain-containing protein [Alloalcanivorax xenomutans]MCE7508417.1 DUF4351 domain-containing protein [Alloalcanivorax xenomutans]MCE7521873.1 DUF4351 domain-containing protein [Alloalcanivorax xenomutans]WOD26658.1 DUF4351 domain-containing protein [Alloalcanivorax xenomutans]